MTFIAYNTQRRIVAVSDHETRELFAAVIPAGLEIAEATPELAAAVNRSIDAGQPFGGSWSIGADGLAKLVRFSVERPGSMVYGRSARGENGGNLGLRRVRR